MSRIPILCPFCKMPHIGYYQALILKELIGGEKTNRELRIFFPYDNYAPSKGSFVGSYIKPLIRMDLVAARMVKAEKTHIKYRIFSLTSKGRELATRLPLVIKKEDFTHLTIKLVRGNK